MMNDNLDIKIIKNYQMIRKVGKGAYGQVWKCVNKRTGIVCGLKRICDGFRNVTDCQRTYRQIMYLKQLDHPNIIKLYNYQKSYNERDMYIQLEFVESDLANVLKNQYLKVAQKEYIFAQIASSIYYLHSGNLLHRDIKPSNVLIGVNCQAKLCDFGLIRYLNNADPENNGDLTDNIATRWYKAPELLLSSCNYGKQIDIWSLGCLLAQLYLEKPLFQGSSTFNQLQKIIEITGIPHIQRISKIIKSETSIAVLKSFINDIPQNEISKKQSQHSYNQSTAKSRSPSSFVEGQCFSLSENHKRLLSIIPKMGQYSSQYQENTLLDLLTKLLQFDPRKRCTIEDVMRHPFLDKFRNKVEWKKIREKIRVKYDNKKLSIAEYKHLLSCEEKAKQFCYQEKKKIFLRKTPEKERKSPKKNETGINNNQLLQTYSDKSVKNKIQIEKSRKLKEKNAEIVEGGRKVSPKPKSTTNNSFTPYIIQKSCPIGQKRVEKCERALAKNNEEKIKPKMCSSKSKQQLKEIKTMYIKTQFSCPAENNEAYGTKTGYFQGKFQKSAQNKSEKKSVSKISNKSSKSKVSNVSGYNRLRLIQNNKTNVFTKNQFVYPSNGVQDVDNSCENSIQLTQEDNHNVENRNEKQTINFHRSVINSQSSKFSYNTIENPVKMNKNPNIIYYPPSANLVKVKYEPPKNAYNTNQQILSKQQQEKMKKSAPSHQIFRKSIHPQPFLEKQIKLNIHEFNSPQKNNLVYVPPQIKTTRPAQIPASPQVAQRNTYIHINQIPAQKQTFQNKLNSNYFQICHIPNRSKFLSQQNSIQSIQSIQSIASNKESQNVRQSLEKKVQFQDSAPIFGMGQQTPKVFHTIRNYSQLNNNNPNHTVNNSKSYNPDILQQQPLLLRQQASIKSTSSFSSINSFTELKQKNYQIQGKLQSKRCSTESFYDKPSQNSENSQKNLPSLFFIEPNKQNFISYQNSPSSIADGSLAQARYFIPSNSNSSHPFNKPSSTNQYSQHFTTQAVMSTPILPNSTHFHILSRQNVNSGHVSLQPPSFNSDGKIGQRVHSPNSGMTLNSLNPSFFK